MAYPNNTGANLGPGRYPLLSSTSMLPATGPALNMTQPRMESSGSPSLDLTPKRPAGGPSWPALPSNMNDPARTIQRFRGSLAPQTRGRQRFHLPTRLLSDRTPTQGGSVAPYLDTNQWDPPPYDLPPTSPPRPEPVLQYPPPDQPGVIQPVDPSRKRQRFHLPTRLLSDRTPTQGGNVAPYLDTNRWDPPPYDLPPSEDPDLGPPKYPPPDQPGDIQPVDPPPDPPADPPADPGDTPGDWDQDWPQPENWPDWLTPQEPIAGYVGGNPQQQNPDWGPETTEYHLWWWYVHENGTPPTAQWMADNAKKINAPVDGGTGDQPEPGSAEQKAREYWKKYNEFFPYFLQEERPNRVGAADVNALWWQNARQGHMAAMEGTGLMGSGYDLFYRQMLSSGRRNQNDDALQSMYQNAMARAHAIASETAPPEPQSYRPRGMDWASLAFNLGSAALGAYALRGKAQQTTQTQPQQYYAQPAPAPPQQYRYGPW